MLIIVVIGVYSANLMSFLSVKKSDLPISTLEDLANNEDYDILLRETGAARGFLQVNILSHLNTV